MIAQPTVGAIDVTQVALRSSVHVLSCAGSRYEVAACLSVGFDVSGRGMRQVIRGTRGIDRSAPCIAIVIPHVAIGFIEPPMLFFWL